MLRFGSLWTGWKALAHEAARIQSIVVLTVLYYLMFVPLAWLRRPFGDPLRDGSDRWRARPRAAHDLASSRRQS